MECPHCGYKHGYDIDGNIKGKEGDFYTLTNNIVASRDGGYYPDETVTVCACPKCKKVFIDD